MRNISNDMTALSKSFIAKSERMITSSENIGDVIVENCSVRMTGR